MTQTELAGRIRMLLATPLSAESAMEIALLNNPALQATYAEAGIAEADLVQAGLPATASVSRPDTAAPEANVSRKSVAL